MTKLFLIFSLLLVSVLAFNQVKPKFVVENTTILPGQTALLNIRVYNMPEMDINALTFIVKTDVPVDKFESTGIDVERWPFVVENFADSFYAAAWIRTAYFSTSQRSIQSYKDGEVFCQLQIKPKYNTNVLVEYELSGLDGKPIVTDLVLGQIITGVLAPPKPKPWACGDVINIKGKNYGTMYLPVQKVCMLTENFDDGNSLKYKGVPTGQYLAKDFVLPEGLAYPTTNALKEAKVPVIDKGYRYVGTTLSQNSNTYYSTSSTGQNNWRVFYNPAQPTKVTTDSNYPTSCWIRLVIKQN